ncbi:hypothetical protein LCGC14_1154330, partial [marine sediment metagenome]
MKSAGTLLAIILISVCGWAVLVAGDQAVTLARGPPIHYRRH